jgi:cobalamin synthase
VCQWPSADSNLAPALPCSDLPVPISNSCSWRMLMLALVLALYSLSSFLLFQEASSLPLLSTFRLLKLVLVLLTNTPSPSLACRMSTQYLQSNSICHMSVSRTIMMMIIIPWTTIWRIVASTAVCADFLTVHACGGA